MGKAMQREMLSQPMKEVEYLIKKQKEKEHDLSLNRFATISGIKGKQFGKELFSSVLKFKDLMDFLHVFPEVQRDVGKRRVSKIKSYVLSGIENPDSMRFFSGITVTARGNVFYDETTHKVAIDTYNSKLSINDGQHRFYGISEAIRELRGRINKSKDSDYIDRTTQILSDLENMVIPLVIFNGISEKEEKQLFHDLNNLAQRPSRSATIKLAQTDLFSRMAREISQENRYLTYYGVEYNKMSIHSINPNTVLLTTVYAMIKNLFYTESKTDFNFLTEDNYMYYKKIAEKTFNDLFYSLPPDLNVKGKYILEKNYALKGISIFIHDCRHYENIPNEKIYDAIKKVNWNADLSYWEKYGAFPSQKGFVQFSGNGEGGIRGVKKACYDQLNK